MRLNLAEQVRSMYDPQKLIVDPKLKETNEDLYNQNVYEQKIKKHCYTWLLRHGHEYLFRNIGSF